MGEITELNVFRKIGEIKKLIRTWQSSNLTRYGKVTIIKSLLTSRITYMLLSLPNPNFLCIKEIENTLSNLYDVANLLNGEKRFLRAQIA